MTRKPFYICLILSAISTISMADYIPYPNIGTPAPANKFTASSDGDITAYFFAQSAGATSEIGMSVNGAAPTVWGLNNHASLHGDMLNLGFAHFGDILEFQLRILPNITAAYYSTPARNSDGLNHTYTTTFSGDAKIPAGTYVAFEDLPKLGDIDYNDHQFVFRPVNFQQVPEPASTFLVAIALAGLCAVRRLNSSKLGANMPNNIWS